MLLCFVIFSKILRRDNKNIKKSHNIKRTMKSSNGIVVMFIFAEYLSSTVLLSEKTTLKAPQNITIAVLLERSSVDMPFIINRTHGLVSMAVKKTREMLEGVANLEYIIMPVDVPGCVATKWGAMFAELYNRFRPHAIIGPGCTPSVQTVSLMASYWDIPHMTYVGIDESLSNKQEYPMLTRLGFTIDVLSKFYIKMLKHFGYTYVANIYDESIYIHNLLGKNLEEEFHHESPHIHSVTVPFNSTAKDLRTELLNTLLIAAKKTRVFLVFCHGDTFRQMALLMEEAGLKEGEYLLILFFYGYGMFEFGDYNWYRGDSLDQRARKAYESVIIVRTHRPNTAQFAYFEQEVKDRAFKEYNYTWDEDSEVSIIHVGHYDSFLLYAHALNETLHAGEDPRDGKAVVKRMWNRTFPGIGEIAFIDENGDRELDFALLDLNPHTGEFQVVLEYLGYLGEVFPRNTIHWPGTGYPPRNIPICGFTGEDCISNKLDTAGIVAICLGVATAICLTGGFIFYRRLKDEASLLDNWWKIKSDDIEPRRRTSINSKPGDENRSLSTGSQAPGYQKMGLYKGMQVHVRKLGIKSLIVDRKFLVELKEMREIGCANLTRLIGVCPEPSNVCMVTEYCARGNLQDILQNESIRLDWDFRISLINDIVEGMNYLHSSPIGVHGRLTSSRCVIDSRFVLKITGFGLDSIISMYTRRNTIRKSIGNLEPYFPELFWVAPELLRLYPPRSFSQDGDVYSFAIILYEMCTRTEPYVNETWYTSVEDTIRRIKECNGHPVRPSVKLQDSFQDIINLAKLCWQELPCKRPTFIQIRRDFKTIKQKRNIKPSENVLDVLLKRMEQYANNLEGLVEERTQAFLEEKKKSEDLLYQVLPKSVANQLRAGRSVLPEAFDSVTIYFSDIVGFTSISAKSSPFEIVDLLNDLYTCFDSIIVFYDVYKVETIGDAYMVVSGLPDRNGSEHVRQIARMALNILNSVRHFKIRHMPDTPLTARIGLHSGPVCAGVVGMKMPRYCLFGDTVNTASRMETNGQALKIHISEETKLLLDLFDGFVVEERGNLEVKGKGTMKTFWLIDEKVTSVTEEEAGDVLVAKSCLTQHL